MSREVYHNSLPAINTGTRSPGTRASRRLTELPTVDRSPSREYGSPLGKTHTHTKNLKLKLKPKLNNLIYYYFR